MIDKHPSRKSATAVFSPKLEHTCEREDGELQPNREDDLGEDRVPPGPVRRQKVSCQLDEFFFTQTCAVAAFALSCCMRQEDCVHLIGSGYPHVAGKLVVKLVVKKQQADVQLFLVELPIAILQADGTVNWW